MNKIKEILDWYKQFNNTNVLIKTKNYDFEFEIENKHLPHLLGLHYSSIKRLTGDRLYNFIKGKKDEEIYKMIKEYNPSKLNNIKERVNNFKYFMENLDKAKLFEQTNKNSKLKSNFLLVKTKDNKFLQLGIARDVENYEYLETFIVRNNDLYIKNSNLSEKVESIEKYDMLKNKFVPFSFDEIKNEMLNSVEYGLNENENIKLHKEVNFDKLTSFNFENFTFYPIKKLEESEINDFYDNSILDSLNYLMIREKFKINLNSNRKNNDVENYFKEKFDLIGKDAIINDFSSKIPSKYKDYDLFYCKETRSLYSISYSGLAKYNKYDSTKLREYITINLNKSLNIDKGVRL